MSRSTACHTVLCSMRDYMLRHITESTLTHIISNLTIDDDNNVFDGVDDLREKTIRLIDFLLNEQPISQFVDAILCVPSNDVSDMFRRLLTEHKPATCYGCQVDHPSQKQHMGLGGCLAEEEDDDDDDC